MKQLQVNDSTLADKAEYRMSALWDGELDDAEARRLISGMKEVELSAWRDFALIRDGLQGEGLVSTGFMARFDSALGDEPTVLAPLPGRKTHAAPYLWTAAAAAMAVITWTVWTAAPPEATVTPQLALALSPAANEVRSLPSDLEPYLAAHQDFAYAVVSMPELVVERVSLAEDRP